MIRRHTRLWVGTTALVMLLQATPALAGQPDTPADEVASVVEAAVEAQGSSLDTVAIPTPTRDKGAVVASARSSARVPFSPSSGVEFDGGGDKLRIGLPGASRAQNAAAASDGTVVYGDAFEDVSIAVQALEGDKIRILVVIDGPDAPTEFRFPLEISATSSIQLMDDGSVNVSDSTGEGFRIEAPWAVDDNGNAVSTSYRIDGTTLVQTVDHTGAAYPVVADPSVSIGWYIYIKYSKSEVVKYSTGFYGAVLDKAKYVVVFCWAVGVVSPLAGTGCALYLYDVWDSVAQTFHSARSQGKCVEMKYTLIAGLLVGWKPYSC